METLGHETSWVSLDTAAAFLECSPQSVRQWAYHDHLEHRFVNGRGAMQIGETSLYRFADKFPAGPNGRRGVRRNEKVEQGIYRVRVKKGSRYEVKLHGHPGKTLPTLESARVYRNYLLSTEDPAATSQATPQHANAWSRIVNRFRPTKTTIA